MLKRVASLRPIQSKVLSIGCEEDFCVASENIVHSIQLFTEFKMHTKL